MNDVNVCYMYSIFQLCVCFSETIIFGSFAACAMKVILTQNLANLNESQQQAVSSSVSAVVRYMAPHGIPRWTFQWMIDDGMNNVRVVISYAG